MNLEMMNTRLSQAEIEKMVWANPAKVVSGTTVILPPARLSFANLGKRGKATNDDGTPREGKFGANLLFTKDADLTALVQARAAMLAENFPANPKGAGMKVPFRDQADRVAPLEGGSNAAGKTSKGYVPGCIFIAPTANNRPPLATFETGGVKAFLSQDEDLIDQTFYSGIWAICAVNPYVTKNTKNPGVFFGLQSVLKVRDDNAFSGGGIDPFTAFGGINIDSSIDPTALFGGAAAPADENDARKALGL